MTTNQERLNRFTDSNWSWWPFLNLRPKKEDRMPSKSGFWATTSFACGLAFGMLLMRALPRIEFPLFGVGLGVLIAWPCFFVFYRATFVSAWDARADELKRQK